MSGTEVVARYADGRVLRGRTWDFRPDRPWFHVEEPGGRRSAERVLTGELKAVFFVRSLDGDCRHVEEKSFRGRRRLGRKTWVEFSDGECLAGWTEGLNAEDPGFFLFPVDGESNNEKVYVMREHVVDLLHDEDAERRAQEVTARSGPPKHYQRLSNGAWEDFLGDPAPRPPARPPSERPRRPPSGLFLQDF